MKNTDTRYGPVSKLLHWMVFLLMINQFVVALAMLNTPEGETTAGFTRANLYEWHKSVGLIAMAVALARYVWRRVAPLPDWAPNLSVSEQRAIHWIERVLYICMFLMPISGAVFVLAGDYPLRFFGRWDVPNVIGVHAVLSVAAKWVHHVTAVALVASLLAHWSVVIRHHRLHRDRYLHRMLPFTHQS